MFDFQKLSVYQKTKNFNNAVINLVNSGSFEPLVSDRLTSNAFDLMLNISEIYASSKSELRVHSIRKAKKSALKCVALLDYLKDTGEMDEFNYLDFAQKLEEILRLLNSLVKKPE